MKIILALFLLIAFPALADEPAEDDPIVVLYASRVELAKAALERQEEDAKLASNRFRHAARLTSGGAITREQGEAAQIEVKVEKKRIAEAVLKVKEAEAMLGLARARRELGITMPICAGN